MKRELGIARCGLACCLCSENDHCSGCNSGDCPDKEWCKIEKEDYLSAMKDSPTNPTPIFNLLNNALTDDIDNRDIFMKGIDYSYYYEEE